jgi:hypothetical protein
MPQKNKSFLPGIKINNGLDKKNRESVLILSRKIIQSAVLIYLNLKLITRILHQLRIQVYLIRRDWE